jgi:predicted PurR-regulated permease PerM
MVRPVPPQRVEIVVGARTLLTLLGVGVIVALALLSLGTLLSIFLAAVLALGLDPVVGALVARGWGRGRAAVVVLAALFVGVVVIVAATAAPVWSEIVDFVHQLPALWDQMQQTEWFKKLVDALGASGQVHDTLKQLANEVPEAASTLLGAAGSVFGSVLSLVTLTFLALFLLMERPAITDWMLGFTAPETDARWRPVIEDSVRAVSSSLLGNVAVSIVAGTVAFISCTVLGLPFPVVLAVITGLLDLIPQVGATVAAVLLTAVALTVSTPAAIATVAVQLIYQQVENYVVYPIVYRRAVELSGLTTIIAVLIAGSLLGVVGAILAVPFAAVIKIVLREAGAPRRARMAALREAAERERVPV